MEQTHDIAIKDEIDAEGKRNIDVTRSTYLQGWRLCLVTSA